MITVRSLSLRISFLTLDSPKHFALKLPLHPKHLLATLVLTHLGTNIVHAQADPLISHFHEIIPALNPAASGLTDVANLIALHRTQWAGLAGHPATQVLAGDMPLYVAGSGMGLSLINDKAGAQRVTDVKLAYSYQRKLKQGILAGGLSVGVIQHTLDGTILRAPEGEYPENSINHNDRRIPSTKVSSVVPDFGLGIYLAFPKWWSGVSVNHLLEPESVLDVATADNTTITFSRQLRLNAGTSLQVAPEVVLSPSLLVRSDLVIHQMELQAAFTYRNNIGAGVALRGYNKASMDAIIGMVSMQFTPKLRAGYSYDVNISALSRVNSGSHELFLNYRIPMLPPSKGKIINNPRFISF